MFSKFDKKETESSREGSRVSMTRISVKVIMAVFVLMLAAALLYGFKTVMERFDDSRRSTASSDGIDNTPENEGDVLVSENNDQVTDDPSEGTDGANEQPEPNSNPDAEGIDETGNTISQPEPAQPEEGTGETNGTGNHLDPAESAEGPNEADEAKPGDEPKTAPETGEGPGNEEGTSPEKEPDNVPNAPAVTGPFYFAYFEVISDTRVKTSIPYLIVRLHGKVNTINPSDLSDIVLTRDGLAVNNSLKYTGEYKAFTWGYEDVTDFYFEFEHNNVEPGRYALSGKYQGIPFNVAEKIIEESVTDAPADADDLLLVFFVYMPDINGDPIDLSELAFFFKGRQNSFYQSDLTELKCFLNGEEIPIEFKNNVIRYYEVNDTSYTQFHLLLKSKFTSPGRYVVTGKYRGVSFKSREIVIP